MLQDVDYSQFPSLAALMSPDGVGQPPDSTPPNLATLPSSVALPMPPILSLPRRHGPPSASRYSSGLLFRTDVGRLTASLAVGYPTVIVASSVAKSMRTCNTPLWAAPSLDGHGTRYHRGADPPSCRLSRSNPSLTGGRMHATNLPLTRKCLSSLILLTTLTAINPHALLCPNHQGGGVPMGSCWRQGVHDVTT